MADYTIDHTQDTFYLDNHGRPVRGFQVDVTLVKWNEGHVLMLPNLDTETVQAAVQALITKREALARLSG